ncbi:hypothetical protein BpHYR1_031596 [Brachionus plicatilis]|uniref:Uncharacterized protein n=1 Tax=Brachionus plicatilis TaxID=10195 RepID=A0A3M7SZW1_BRAPC|nr:hypothetical protein BpHYR1_031596 [Brachionus plicatilis]
MFKEIALFQEFLRIIIPLYWNYLIRNAPIPMQNSSRQFRAIKNYFQEDLTRDLNLLSERFCYAHETLPLYLRFFSSNNTFQEDYICILITTKKNRFKMLRIKKMVFKTIEKAHDLHNFFEDFFLNGSINFLDDKNYNKLNKIEFKSNSLNNASFVRLDLIAFADSNYLVHIFYKFD